MCVEIQLCPQTPRLTQAPPARKSLKSSEFDLLTQPLNAKVSGLHRRVARLPLTFCKCPTRITVCSLEKSPPPEHAVEKKGNNSMYTSTLKLSSQTGQKYQGFTHTGRCSFSSDWKRPRHPLASPLFWLLLPCLCLYVCVCEMVLFFCLKNQILQGNN